MVNSKCVFHRAVPFIVTMSIVIFGKLRLKYGGLFRLQTDVAFSQNKPPHLRHSLWKSNYTRESKFTTIIGTLFKSVWGLMG